MVVRRKRGTRPSRHARRSSPEAITEVDSYSSDSSNEHLCDDDTDDSMDDSDSTGQPKKKKPRRAASGSATTTRSAEAAAAAAAAARLRAQPPPRTRRAALVAVPVGRDDDDSSSDSSSSSSEDDDDSVTTVSTGNLNTSCSVKGCAKLSRGKYGFCRKHGGGAKCRTGGCRKFARVGGYCPKHGGFVHCTASGCRQRAVLLGLCALHMKTDTKCTRPGCVMPAGEDQAQTGLCNKHAPSSRECHHGGCLLNREGRKGKWCAGHTAAKRLLELKLGREGKQQRGAPATRCRHFLPGKGGICGAKALRAFERCPTHQLLSTCGTVGCHVMAQREGKCAPHANLDECSAEGCFRVASRQGPKRLPVCGVHAHWKNVCTSKGCRTLVFRQAAACRPHQDTKLQATHMAARLMASPSAHQAARTLLGLARLNVRPPPPASKLLVKKDAPAS